MTQVIAADKSCTVQRSKPQLDPLLPVKQVEDFLVYKYSAVQSKKGVLHISSKDFDLKEKATGCISDPFYI